MSNQSTRLTSAPFDFDNSKFARPEPVIINPFNLSQYNPDLPHNLFPAGPHDDGRYDFHIYDCRETNRVDGIQDGDYVMNETEVWQKRGSRLWFVCTWNDEGVGE